MKHGIIRVNDMFTFSDMTIINNKLTYVSYVQSPDLCGRYQFNGCNIMRIA